MMDDSSLVELVLSNARRQDEPFQPVIRPSEDGDCIEFILSDEPFKGDRIDSFVTVYYGLETGEIVGSLIKGVSKIRNILAQVPGLQVEVHDGKMGLSHWFAYRQFEAKDECAAVTYKRLRESAERVEENVESELELCLN